LQWSANSFDTVFGLFNAKTGYIVKTLPEV